MRYCCDDMMMKSRIQTRGNSDRQEKQWKHTKDKEDMNMRIYPPLSVRVSARLRSFLTGRS
jgi:hypothetical protein